MEPDRDIQPLQGLPLILAAFAINLAVFAEVLDLTIINVAIPAVAGSLGASQLEGTWAISSYALAAALVQPLTGWLTGRIGEVRLFMWSTGLFAIASVLCGLAPNLEGLVLARLLQGAVSGPLIPLSQTLLLKSFPARQRGLAQALWGATALVAPVCGPVIGGWLTDNYSWRWAFLVNLPVGLFTVSVLWFLMRKRDTNTKRGPVDVTGALLMFVGIGAMQWLLDNGHHQDWFESDYIRMLAVVSIIGLVLFWLWERNEPHPIVDFSLFRLPNFAVGATLAAGCYAVAFGIVLTFPLWLQTVGGYTATLAGLASVSFGIAAIPSALAIGIFSDRLPKRTLATAGLLLFAAGSIWLALLPAEASFWQLTAPRVLHGMAIPMTWLPLTDMMLSRVSGTQMASAAAISGFLRTLALSISVAVTVTIWDRRTDFHHIVLAEGVTPSRLTGLLDLGSLMGRDLFGPEGISAGMTLMERLAFLQSRTLAFNDLCWLSAVLFLLMIPFVWRFEAMPKRTASSGGFH